MVIKSLCSKRFVCQINTCFYYSFIILILRVIKCCWKIKPFFIQNASGSSYWIYTAFQLSSDIRGHRLIEKAKDQPWRGWYSRCSFRCSSWSCRLSRWPSTGYPGQVGPEPNIAMSRWCPPTELLRVRIGLSEHLFSWWQEIKPFLFTLGFVPDKRPVVFSPMMSRALYRRKYYSNNIRIENYDTSWEGLMEEEIFPPFLFFQRVINSFEIPHGNLDN